MTAYVAYGVRLQSEFPIAGLPAPCGGEPTTIEVLLDPPSGRDSHNETADAEFLVEGRPLSLHVNGGLEVRWQDTLRFRMSIGDSVIRCAQGPDGTAEQVHDWLLHYALPLLLAGTGRVRFLHGSAVQVGRRAVGFLAPSGGGKTTLAEYFLRRGHAYFTDEKLCVAEREQGFAAVPSTPFYRGDADPRWRKVGNYAPLPLPLETLYVLAPASAESAPAVAPLPAGAAAFQLARHCEFDLPPRVRGRLRLPSFQLTCFQFCTQLAAAARVCRLVVPRDRARLPAVYETVLADLGVAA